MITSEFKARRGEKYLSAILRGATLMLLETWEERGERSRCGICSGRSKRNGKMKDETKGRKAGG
jgi:hypothetical protein